MLSFVLTGTVGCVSAPGDQTVLAVSSQRSVSSSRGFTVEWVSCLARDAVLQKTIALVLSEGDIVRIEGEIEPRRREIRGVAIYDVMFVVQRFERLGSRSRTCAERFGESSP